MNKFNLSQFSKDKNYVIEASAGTGKTYNIVEIVDKLVNNENIDLHSILIVTYTEKAAGELKDRVRSKIKDADVDNAPIYTIHSFCQNAIKEFGLSANLPFNLNVIDENELQEFAQRYVREGEILKEVSFFFENDNLFDIDVLIDILSVGTKKYYLNQFGQEDDSIISIPNIENFDELLKLKKDIIESETVVDLLENYPEMKSKYNVLENCASDAGKKLYNELQTGFKNDFKFNGRIKRSNKNTNEVNEAIDYFTEVHKKLDNVKNETLIAIKYLKDFYLKWQEYKEINKSQTFDDMIRYVRESILNDDKLKNKLKAKYKRAIIDEFQDTNQKQFDIFSKIFLEDDDHKIIVVGDPKQSIYSFQGADINVYHNAVTEIEKNNGERCMLNKNYRSTGDMVHACNKLFEYYDFDGCEFEDCGYLSLENGDNDLHEVLYNGEKPKAFWIADGEDGEGMDEVCFAEIAVQQILEFCSYDDSGVTKLQIKDKKEKKFRNVSFKDFAFLARTSTEMRPIERALKNAGIPYLRYKDKDLFKGKECTHWIALLEAINVNDFTGRNRKKFKKSLFTNFFGVSIKDINSDYYNRDDIFEIELFMRWKEYARVCKWEDLFDDIILSSGITDRLKSLKEIQSLSIYRQISNYCIDYLSRGKTIDELIRNLNSLSDGGSSNDDEQNGNIVEKSTNFDCVQIMTMHASKGLQFPVVISVGGFKKPVTNGNVFTCHTEPAETETKKQIMVFDRNDTVIQEEIGEWKRLFYVAYTRPQFILLLPNYQKFGHKFLEQTLHDFMENHTDLYKLIYNKHTFSKRLRDLTSAILSKSSSSKESPQSKETQDDVLKQIIKESVSKKSYKHSYSSLSHDHIEQLDEEDSKEGLIEEGLAMFDKSSKQVDSIYDVQANSLALPSDYPRGAKLGTALHEIFEGLDFCNYEENLDLKITRCFAKQGVIAKESWKKATVELVRNVLTAIVPTIQGSIHSNEYFKLSDITVENKLDEVEFNFNIFNEKLKNYCTGFVDMIFRRGEYYSIVDWKSDVLNDTFESYSISECLRFHVNDCYSIQRVLYSYCLIKTLKMQMPLLNEQEIFEKHFGGIYYVFLRGCIENTGNGIYCQTWNSWNDLENEFINIVHRRIGGFVRE